jgi:hypothetical protein
MFPDVKVYVIIVRFRSHVIRNGYTGILASISISVAAREGAVTAPPRYPDCNVV